MVTRRNFLRLAGGAGITLLLPGCAGSPPFRKDLFPDFGGPGAPYLGLATSLPEEYDYEAGVEGRIPSDLRGTLYRNGPGLFDRGGLWANFWATNRMKSQAGISVYWRNGSLYAFKVMISERGAIAASRYSPPNRATPICRRRKRNQVGS